MKPYTNNTFAELDDPTSKYGKQYQAYKATAKKPLDLTGPSEYDPSKNAPRGNESAWGPLPTVDTSWATEAALTSKVATAAPTPELTTQKTTAQTTPTISYALPQAATVPALTNTNTVTVPEFVAKKTSTPSTFPYISKTIDPKLSDINYTTTVNILKNVSDYVSLFPQIEKEIQISLDYYIALQKNNVVNVLSDFYNALEKNKMPLLRNDFVDYWVKRYQITAEPLKTLITFNLDTTKNSFYTDLSDSIGLLVNSNCLLDDSTIPFTDYNTSIYTAPNTLPVQLRNKISKTTLQVAASLSESNTILMRNNLAKINLTTANTDPYTNPTTNPAHGLNLITDINTFNIIKAGLTSHFNELKNSYKRIFNYVQYISNINNINGYNPRDIGKNGTNQQLVTDILFGMNVEKFTVSMDTLQRKFKYLLGHRTIENCLSNKSTTNQENGTGIINLTTPGSFS
jgi:hypothetical protein